MTTIETILNVIGWVLTIVAVVLAIASFVLGCVMIAYATLFTDHNDEGDNI